MSIGFADVVRDMLWRPPDESRAAAQAVARYLAALSAEDLPAAGEHIRNVWRGSYYEPAFVTDANAGLQELLSFHPSGYVRELAVYDLATRTDGSELPYLLLRLGDWVPQVRAAARRVVGDRLKPGYAAAFARDFILVDRLERSGRAGRESLIEPLSRLFANAQPALLGAMRTASRQSRRALVRFALDHVPGAVAAVVAMGAEAKDEVIRRWIVPFVAELPALQRLAADMSSAVRQEALRALVRAFPREAEPLLERAWFDPSASVRDLARFLSGPRDFVSIYRTAVDTRPAVALAGLSEVGTAADAATAAPHLAHPTVSVRRAAVRCVMRLAGDAYADRVAAMLADPSPGVSAAARDALRNHAATVGRHRLEELFATATSLHTRRNVVRLFSALPKWPRILCLVRAAGDPATADAARAAIQTWNRQFNRSNATPSARELDELTSALAATGKVLDPETVREILFAMNAFRA